jgi:hypothetical protein
MFRRRGKGEYMKCRICGYENDFVTRCPFKELPSHGKTKKEHDAIKRAAEQTDEAPEYWHGWLVERGVVQEGPYKGWSAGLAALDYHNKERNK